MPVKIGELTMAAGMTTISAVAMWDVAARNWLETSAEVMNPASGLEAVVLEPEVFSSTLNCFRASYLVVWPLKMAALDSWLRPTFLMISADALGLL